MNAGAKFLDHTADWAYLAAVPEALQAGQYSPAVFRQVLDAGSDLLRERFAADEAVEDLVRDRARLVDMALRAAWVQHAGKFAGDLALVAVGGYGRGELHPSSDIDIMVLLPKSDSADWQSDIERFLTFLWDIGLEVGHSVRSIDDCQRESLADISVATTLFEARLLAGPESLFAGHAPRARARSAVVVAGFLRGQGQGTDRAPPPLLRHRLQPRAERQIEPGGLARHPDHRLGGEAAFRHRHAR